MNKTKILILITVFIDVVGLGIIIPILPFYVERFSSSPFIITSLFAVYATCSFFSAPVIGAISDKIGRKFMLILSIFSTSLGWFVFAAAPNLLFLFLGRIIDGLAAGNFPIAQAYLTDIARDDRERTTNLGLIGAVFGIAFILGPFFGGVLGSISHAFPFWFVGCLALVNGILAIFFLPETHNRPRLAGLINNAPIERSEHRGTSINPFSPIMRATRNKVLLPNYSAWFLVSLALATFQSTFALYTQGVFGFTQFTVGILFTGMGVIIALNQAALLKHIWLKYFKEPRLELIMLIVFASGYLLMTASVLSIFVIGLIAVTFGQSVLRVVMNSQIVSKANPAVKGEVLGITSSITSLGMALGPFVAGYFFGLDKRMPFASGAMFLLGAFFILYQNRKNLSQNPLPEDVHIISQI